MLHAAAMLTGLFFMWLALTQRGLAAVDIAVAAGVALTGVLVGWRLGGIGRGYTRAPRLMVLRLSRAGAVGRGALKTLRAAIAADISLTPALVRVKSRVKGAGARAVLAEMISAAPGEIVVEADGEGLLVHVNDEDGVDAAALGLLEAQVVRATDQEAPA